MILQLEDNESSSVVTQPAGTGTDVVFIHSRFPGQPDRRVDFHAPPLRDDTNLRFRVGDERGRSSEWSVFANEGKNDIYVGARDSAGELKVSFHESGEWHVGRTRPSMIHDARNSRIANWQGEIALERWAGQGTFPTEGDCRLLTVACPANDVVPTVVPPTKKQTEVLRRPPRGSARLITLSLHEDSERISIPYPLPVDTVLAGFRLPQGRTLIVTSCLEAMTAEFEDAMSQHRKRLTAQRGRPDGPPPGSVDLRVAHVWDPGDGLFLFDLAEDGL